MSLDGSYVRGDSLMSIPGMEGMGATNASIRPHFFMEPRRMPDGKFQDFEMVEIHMGGDVKSAPVRKVTDTIRRMYQREYDLFKAGLEQTELGTPIEMLLGKTSAALNFRARNVTTVETLAALSDSQLQELGMGGRAMRERAAAFLVSTEKAKEAERLESDKLQLEQKLAARDDMIATLAARLEALEGAVTEPAKRGPGRPPKTETHEAA